MNPKLRNEMRALVENAVRPEPSKDLRVKADEFMLHKGRGLVSGFGIDKAGYLRVDVKTEDAARTVRQELETLGWKHTETCKHGLGWIEVVFQGD